MSQYLFLLAVALVAGVVPGYFLWPYRKLWIVADLLWVAAAIPTAYFAVIGVERISSAADRAFAVEKLAGDKDHIRLAAYRLENQNCGPVPSSKGRPLADTNTTQFCGAVRKVLFFTTLTHFSESDANRLAKEIDSFQAKFFPDGSHNLLGGLKEYARFYTLRKNELEVNPYQDLVVASSRLIFWFYVLMGLLAFRSGRTFAEYFRARKENDAQPCGQPDLAQEAAQGRLP